MERKSNFFREFIYEYTSTDDMVSKRNEKLAYTESKGNFINQKAEKTAQMQKIYFGGSSGQIHLEFEWRPEIEFCSGSSYLGEWNQFGMFGKGFFMFPNGIRYQGRLSEGSFHGKGKLIYPNGVQIHATWKHGKASKAVLFFSEGLKFKRHNWKYCQHPDHRFRVCIDNGIPAVGNSYLTPFKPDHFIPKGCYDTIDGIFNPKLKIVYNPNTRRIIRIPTTKECEWIIKNCRRGTFDEIPEFRKPVRPESYYNFDEIRLKGLSECSSKKGASLKLEK